jgi:hypothetical protein
VVCRNLDVIFFAESPNGVSHFAGKTAGEAATCGEFSWHRRYAGVDASGAAHFFEAECHVGRFERGGTEHGFSLQSLGQKLLSGDRMAAAQKERMAKDCPSPHKLMLP